MDDLRATWWPYQPAQTQKLSCGQMIDPPALSTNEAAPLGAMVWRLPDGLRALSSAPVGGGSVAPDWLLNVRVDKDYCRVDIGQHISEVATDFGLDSQGIGLLTAANIDHWRRSERPGISVDVSSGVGQPTFAAGPQGSWSDWKPGTINIVAHLDVALSPAAAVNAVITMTEAKSQALADLDIPGTGTATDAVVVLWPEVHHEQADFCGPRSKWGARLANATHEAVRDCTIASTPWLSLPATSVETACSLGQ